MTAFHPLQTLDTHQWLAGAKEHEHMVIHALGQLACVELIAGLAREKTPAPELMDLEASAARIFNKKAVLVRTHKPAPLRTIRHSTVEQ